MASGASACRPFSANFSLFRLYLRAVPIALFVFLHLSRGANASRVYTALVLNGTSQELRCEPAELLVRTHMAPDFESPQLIRRLDWFQDNAPIASYQQDVAGEQQRQWWVADPRFRLVKPFYALRVEPVLPADSGEFKCRVETDPLFVTGSSTAAIQMIVQVKPPTPSKPQISGFTERSVTLSWSQSAAAAHKPILRYAILVSEVDDDNMRVVSATTNATTATITDLKPYTRYAFSVRGENAAGNSNFGSEVVFRTLGEAPSSPPTISSIRNGSAACVDVVWKKPDIPNGEIVGYRIMVHRLGSGAMREWYLKGTEHSLCSLAFFADFMLSIEADNGFGYSPSASLVFRTDQSAPEGPPEQTTSRPLSATTVMLTWDQPSVTNGRIVSYQIYFKPIRSTKSYSLVRLKVNSDASRSFAYNITGLAPHTGYKFKLSASTPKGESPKSSALYATTDFAPPRAPTINEITYDCKHTLFVAWKPVPETHALLYKVYTQGCNSVTLNTTSTSIEIHDLILNCHYTVQVAASVRSSLDNITYIQGNFSKAERFAPVDKCQITSSLCASSTERCSPYAGSSSSSTTLTTLLFASGLFLFVVASLTSVYFLKGQCAFVKNYLKKSELKMEEATALVYEPQCGCSIAVALFDDYCKQLEANDNTLYRQQFEELNAVDASDELVETECLDENREKNRYLNIGAMEATRIRINSTSGSSDYINANYVDSCEKQNAYIATQAPLPHTFVDFWTMVWQEKCNIIVVITNMVERGRRKCDQYWPANTKSSMQFGNYTVTLSSEHINANFIHRIFTLKSSKCLTGDRTVHQLHFTSWPDHGVPDTVFPLLSFLNYTAEIQATGPTVVHCSAGVGRSGSFILIDSMRRHLLSHDHLNIYGHLRHIRQQRAKLVQTVDQYIFCHEAIRLLLRHGITRVPTGAFLSYVKYLVSDELEGGKTRMQMQFEDACLCKHNPRCPNPDGYITLPGYHRADEFLVANWQTETADLWKVVWEKNCQTLLLIGSDFVAQKFWAIENGPNREDELCVRILRVDPSSIEVDVWGELERIQGQRLQYHHSSLLLVDPENTSLPLILSALTSLACQIEQERHLDVLHFLVAYRKQRCNAWPNQCNVEYIYEKMIELLEMQKR
ncbi:hypothetical protein QR680_002920 [Steinernema hermaphroditum]|uniref:protein-tyrosine-phosphatase n=1 Tax=Steinernema hermaphroditum TaxID=289476 RepID=A0AA39H4Q4_9BILA|nr:hypothetical protein QR680_002920 [Steinernema hermaphroditum]